LKFYLFVDRTTRIMISNFMGKLLYIQYLFLFSFIFVISCNSFDKEPAFPFDETEYAKPLRTKAIDSVKNKLPDKLLPSRYSINNNILVPRDTGIALLPPIITKPKPLKIPAISVNNSKPAGNPGVIDLIDSVVTKIKAKKTHIKGKVVIAGSPVSKEFQMPDMKDDAINNIQNIGINQNLPGNDVRSIIKDKYGRIWVGTDNGLALIEGELIKTYRIEQGLSHNTILKLMEDSKGRIWIGTNGGGVCAFDGMSFVHFTTQQGLSFNCVNDIIEDSEGRIWIATDKGGVDVLDVKNDISFHLGNNQGISQSIYALIVDDHKQVWISSGIADGFYSVSEINKSLAEDGLLVVNYKINQETAAENCFNWNACMLQDSKSRIWLGSVGGGIGCLKNRTINYYSRNEGMLFDNIASMMEDSEKNLWIGTLGAGISKFDGKHFINYTIKEGMSSNFAMCILENDDVNIWIGTSTGGINIIGKTNAIYLSPKNSIIENYVSSVAEDDNGNIYMGMMGEGMAIFDGKEFTHFFKASTGIVDTYINSLLVDNQQRIFIATSDAGFNVFDNIKFKCYYNYLFYGKNYLSTNYIKYLLETKEKKIWIATYGGGINIYNPLEPDKEAFTHITKSEGLSSDFVTCLLQDSKGNIWAGTSDEGVNVFSENTITIFKAAQGLSDNHINCILEDAEGKIWIGTVNSGLCIYDGGYFTNYTTKQGLADNSVRQFGIDSLGNVWAGTGKGLTKFVKTGTGYQPTNYGKNQGLKEIDFRVSGNPILVNKYTKIVDKGCMWFGAGQTLTIMEIPETDTCSPKTFITQIDINNQPVNWSNVNKLKKQKTGIKWEGHETIYPYNLPQNLELPHNCNTINFYFSGMKLSEQDKIRYRYILQGYDAQWNFITHDNKAEYRNLPHGTYTFRIRSRSSNMKWSNEASFNFTIHPPFWLTWWAYFIYAFLIISMIILIVKWNTRRLLKQKKKLEMIIKERTSEIVLQKNEIQTQAQELKSINEELIELNKFKEGLTGMIVHDLKNPLNNIINQAQEPEVLQAGKQMLNMVLNILDVQKFEKTKMEIRRDDFSLYSCIKEALLQIKLLYERKSIIIANNTVCNCTVNGDFEIIQRVFINLLTNAIKYSPNNSEIYINVVQNLSDDEISEYTNAGKFADYVLISVTDSGQGIPQAMLHSVFEKFAQINAISSGSIKSTGLGLAFCKIAVEAHGGKIGVKSIYGKGATFWFLLPKSNKQNNALLYETTEINNNPSYTINTEDEKNLLVFKQEFSKLSVYEFSDIMEILKKIDTKNENIARWKMDVENAVKSCNEEKYNKLTGL